MLSTGAYILGMYARKPRVHARSLFQEERTEVPTVTAGQGLNDKTVNRLVQVTAEIRSTGTASKDTPD
jgi:hypothetical protein